MTAALAAAVPLSSAQGTTDIATRPAPAAHVTPLATHWLDVEGTMAALLDTNPFTAKNDHRKLPVQTDTFSSEPNGVHVLTRTYAAVGSESNPSLLVSATFQVTATGLVFKTGRLSVAPGDGINFGSRNISIADRTPDTINLARKAVAMPAVPAEVARPMPTGQILVMGRVATGS